MQDSALAHIGNVLLVESLNLGAIVCSVLLTFRTPAGSFYEIIRKYGAYLASHHFLLFVVQPHGPDASGFGIYLFLPVIG